MEYLPKDPAILVSSVNMLLRDEEFDTLESLCYAFSRDPKEIKDYLYKRGFVWSEQQKQFRPIGIPWLDDVYRHGCCQDVGHGMGDLLEDRRPLCLYARQARL